MRLLSTLILSLSLLAGLYLAGQQIGEGSARFRADNRTITVKGLAEQEVKADQAIWKVSFRRAGNDFGELQKQISTDKLTVLDFLQKQGFKPSEITQQPTRTVDKLANEYGSSANDDKVRYILTGQILINTSNVDLVKSTVEKLDSLQASGVQLVLLDVGQTDGPNPRFVLAHFNDQLRPQLLNAAVQNARATAEQLAKNLGVKVGRLSNANQGVIQIFGQDGQDESSGMASSSSLTKRLRVVSTVEFDVK